MNFSNISQYQQVTQIDVKDIIKDYVMQVDNKIILAILLIMISYCFYSIILPRTLTGLKELSKNIGQKEFFKQIIWIIERLISLFETIALGSGIFIIVIAHIQGILSKNQYIIIFSVLGLLFFVLLIEGIALVRKKIVKNKASMRVLNG